MTGVATHPAAPTARFRDLVAAEWIKLWSLRSTPWVLLVTAAAVIGVNANAAYADYANWPSYDAEARRFVVEVLVVRNAFTNNAAVLLVLACGTVGALAVVSEYATGMVRTVYAAVPARQSVVAAKAVVMAALMTVFGAAVAAASLGVTRAILAARGAEAPIADGEVLRALGGSALLAPVAALVGMGLGVLVRHVAATVVATVLLLIVLPSFLDDRRPSTAALKHATPLSAWNRLAEPDAMARAAAYPMSVPESWIVLAAWPALALPAAVSVVRRRDL
ncbi:ABC transporter permease [Yinghuangia sp. YIM S09857]|uniref:ABC transporter permease n=1 Tax=Yinghuangia sp. YIM S09857 TaxID=3436929 RepID=UPI003F5378E5